MTVFPAGRTVPVDRGKVRALMEAAVSEGDPEFEHADAIYCWEVLALLAELEQAERERDDLGPLFVRDCCRLLGVDANDYFRMDKIEARLARVPALVGALKDAVRLLDAALAEWEQA